MIAKYYNPTMRNFVAAATKASVLLAVGGTAHGESAKMPAVLKHDVYAVVSEERTKIVDASKFETTQRYLFPQASKQHFQDLVSIWRRETSKLSSVTKKINSWGFKAILKLGDAAVPHILDALRESDLDPLWFFALEKITKASPVVHGRPTVDAAREAWLAWAEQSGYGQCKTS